MKNYLIIFFLFFIGNCFAQGIKLKNGDLIFQEACPSDPDNPIKAVTNSIGNYQFTHVGIVYIDDEDQIFVLEATTPEVSLTSLSEYLYPEEEKECYPKSVVGRLKPEYQSLIPKALEIGFTLIEKAYDYGYMLNNDQYYCSELIYEIFRQANEGKDIFPLNVMTFKSKDTEDTAKGWIEHFNKHNLPIPEGELGINPGAMSRCEVVDLIFEL